jgi:hypothetical protein
MEVNLTVEVVHRVEGVIEEVGEEAEEAEAYPATATPTSVHWGVDPGPDPEEEEESGGMEGRISAAPSSPKPAPTQRVMPEAVVSRRREPTLGMAPQGQGGVRAEGGSRAGNACTAVTVSPPPPLNHPMPWGMLGVLKASRATVEGP